LQIELWRFFRTFETIAVEKDCGFNLEFQFADISPETTAARA